MKCLRLAVSAYTVPTDAPESDGTLCWDSTTLVLVEATAAGITGVGYSYADTATALLIREKLAPLLEDIDPMDIPRAHATMVRSIRNLGRPGICSMAISAVDNALWDLKARLHDLPLFKLLGALRGTIDIYGSGGFTSYTDDQLREQLGGWAAAGIPRVKMKVGREPERDIHRLRTAREAIGPDVQLFVDANSAYDRKQALDFIDRFSEDFDIRWMEQPLAPEDLEGLRMLRDRAPARVEIADGEYGYELPYFRRMLAAGAVDVLMPDATRCGGITGLLAVGRLCEAFNLPLSAHCAPSLHAHLGCALPAARHIEYFHDHVRIEHMLFDGALSPVSGALRPDPGRPGLGLVFKHRDAQPYAV